MEPKPRVLLVEDDADWLDIYIEELQSEDYILESARLVENAVRMLSEKDIDVVVADLRMIGFKHNYGGFEVLNQAQKISPDTLVIIITAFGTREVALQAMQQGAYDYITKPIDYEKFRWSIVSAIQVRREKMQKKNKRLLETAPTKRTSFQNILGNSKNMQSIFEMIRKACSNSNNVLILGESGTGKRLIAKAIHLNSSRHTRPLQRIDCATLMESSLSRGVLGLPVAEIEGTTLFFDEIGALAPDLQDRVISLIRDKSFRETGEDQLITLDVRIIASTNRNLEEMMQLGTFRRSLYDCLNEFPVRVPPLRERKDGNDILTLAGHFLRKYADEKKSELEFSEEVLNLLTDYDYPGNVRELENAVRISVILADGDVILPEYLPSRIRNYGHSPDEKTKTISRELDLANPGQPIAGTDLTGPSQERSSLPTLKTKLTGKQTLQSGISSHLYRQLRTTLLDCGPIGNDSQLRAMFANASLSPWRHAVPQAVNAGDRADALIAFLAKRRRSDTKENALVLFLHILSERIDPYDECHTRLVELTNQLEEVLKGD